MTAHLHVLVDRACRGVASPAETEQLRAAIAQLQQQAAKVADLHEGEEPYEDEHTVPTPGQWLWLWNRATPERRLAMAAHVLEQQERLNQYTWTERIELHERAEAAERRLAAIAGCDHRDPNRLGARPSDLATVCACGHQVSPPIFGRTITPMQQSANNEIRANVQALMEQYVADQRRQQAAAQEAAIEAYLAAGGFTVLRTNPVEQVAADHDTLNHLGAALARISARDTLSLGQIGQLTGYPLVADDSLPPGEVHLRPHPQLSEPRTHNSNTWQDQDTGERNVSCEDCPAYADNIGDEDDATEWAERHQAEATAEDAALQ